jgi:Caspase domain
MGISKKGEGQHGWISVPLADALLPVCCHGLQVGGQNYLVPIDAKLTTASAIDFEMVRLDLVHRTMERETNTNILIMDACRDNPLARNLTRALGTRSTQIGRGLAPVESGEGTLISFSTQPGNVALDGTGRNSPYVAALLKHITTPDDLPTILINVRNDVMQATSRRQVPWEHSALTAKFYFIPPLPPKPTAEQLELLFWTSVKNSTSPAVLGTYLERYPTGEFAPIARALIEHYDRQLKLELAALERGRRREEEEMKAAEAKRLKEEQRAREVALAEERKRAEVAKNTQEAQRLEKEMLAHNEELRKALEEVRIAREAAKVAEDQRLAAIKSAEKAAKTAEQTIAAKREAEKTGDPAKVAALPKLDVPQSGGAFDGRWTITRSSSERCSASQSVFSISILGNIVHGPGGRGSVSATGEISILGKSNRFSGRLRGNSGSGTYSGRCEGTFTARRN